MIPEFEIELLHRTLAERRRQTAVDVNVSAVAATAASGPSLLERLFGLLRFDAAHLPAAERAALQTDCRPSR